MNGTEMSLRYRDLGPIGLLRGDDLEPVPGTRAATVLCVLLVNANQRVSVDSLVDAVWGSDLRGTEAHTLAAHVSRLRKMIGEHRRDSRASSAILHNAQGYQLLVGPDQADSLQFARLADEVRQLLSVDQPARALSRCDDALDLWRGPPWAPFTDGDWAAPAAARLSEMRNQVNRHRIDALLRLGRLSTALTDVGVLIANAPLQEDLWARQMLALYRSGRTEEALACYGRLRRLLVDELGVEPGADAQRLHAQILDQDPALAGPVEDRTATGSAALGAARGRDTGETTSAPSVVIRPEAPAAAPGLVDLPRARLLVGRVTELAELSVLLRHQRLISVTGSPGCGKTSLAVEAARAAAADFPDGVHFVDLLGVSDGEQLISAVTSAVRLVPSAAEPVVDTLASFARGRRMLLLLDNCEHLLAECAELTDRLLSVETETVLLTTTREPLDVLGERVWPLQPLAVDAGSGQQTTNAANAGRDDVVRAIPAVALFLTRLRTVNPGLGVGPDELETIRKLCVAVDGVPLAVELAAAQARAFTLTEILERVQHDVAGLARVGHGGPPGHASLRHAVDLSVSTLNESQAAMHTALSVIPGAVTTELASVLAGSTASSAQSNLAQLVHCSLVTPLGPRTCDRPSRFAQLATIRSHGLTSISNAQRILLAQRRDDWVLALAHRLVPALIGGTFEEWQSDVEDNLAAVRTTLHHLLVEEPSAVGVAISCRLSVFWYHRGMTAEWERWTRLALSVSPDHQSGDRLLSALTHAGAVAFTGRCDVLDEVLQVIDGSHLRMTDDQQFILALQLLSLGALAWRTGDTKIALQAYQLGRTAAETSGERTLLALADTIGFMTAPRPHKPDLLKALGEAEHLWAQAPGAGDRVSWMVASRATMIAVQLADPAASESWSLRALRQCRPDSLGRLPSTLEVRGAALMADRRFVEAVQLFSASRTHARRIGHAWPTVAVTRPLYDQSLAQLSPADAERAERVGARLTFEQVVAVTPTGAGQPS